ncbi:MAG TPA: right-handed parallel beta-helix repeat-containing protein [Solirubrobacteraceae bacterium]|nr:right-handed parallel beta-helix repeat-containing protein [Solirubrobacteraceae bacterium]
MQAPVLTITGTTYYVSASGSDSNSGTSPGSAWRTVQHVNRASLRPGDGVLFEGGATFSDETLMPSVSGASGSPVIFGSYGQGNATLPQGVWFRGHNHLAFEHLTIGPEGGFQGTGEDVTIEWCTIGNDSLAINAAAGSSNSNNTNWTIDDNTIDHTGNSGMLLEGEDFTVSGNTITNTGLDTSIPYGKHGIYLKVANATVTDNTITNFSEDGVSVRYRNSTVANNYISGGSIGIAWFQYDPIAGTSHWTGNTILGTTAAGFYVSSSNIGGATRESFVITNNTIQPSAGVFMNLQPSTGSYIVQENTQI